MTPVLEGRVAIITGANQGLGRAIARSYAEAGANLVLCARDEDLLQDARAEIQASARVGQKVVAVAADVSRDVDVSRVVQDALNNFSRVHILVNNAGVYGPKGAIEDINWDEWVNAIRINLLGSVLLCRALVPHFKAQLYGKIIQLSGGGATAPLPLFSAYAASKAAIVRFVETLAEEARSCKIDVNAIAPGALNTRLLDEVLEAGPQRVGQQFYDRALRQKAEGGTPLEKGAELAVFLGSAASDGVTGKLISAVWDNWREFPLRRSELALSDVYTLRRIVPKDRGLDWE